jgi:hypothetical protein
MRNTLMRFLGTAAILLSLGPVCAAATESELLEKSRFEWAEFLEKECPDGTSEQVVRKVMEGKYLDVGSARATGDCYLLLFLIDDYDQVEFGFGGDRKLTLKRIVPKEQWLRSPDGWVVSVPSKAERQMSAKAQQVAIQYVAERTTHSRDALEATCWRTVKASTWEVLVDTKKYLAVIDTIGYHLEVTDDGHVKETTPFRHEREP